MEEWRKFSKTLATDTGSVTREDGRVIVERAITYRDVYTEEEYAKLKADHAEGFKRYMETR